MGGGSLESRWSSELGIEVIGYDIFHALTNFWNVLLTDSNGLADRLSELVPTKEKYNEIIPLIIKEFLDAGFINTQKFFEIKIDHTEGYNHLKGDNVSPDKITAQKTSKSNMIIRRYMSHIYEVEDSKGINFLKLCKKQE